MDGQKVCPAAAVSACVACLCLLNYLACMLFSGSKSLCGRGPISHHLNIYIGLLSRTFAIFINVNGDVCHDVALCWFAGSSRTTIECMSKGMGALYQLWAIAVCNCLMFELTGRANRQEPEGFNFVQPVKAPCE